MQEDACKWFYELLQGISPFKDVLPAFGDVFHLASIVGGRAVIDGDPILVSYDLAIDALFFNWVVKSKDRIKRVMYASSSAAYPIDLQQTTKAEKSGTIALSEDMLPTSGRLGEPDMTYGWSKMTGEFLARLAASRYGVHVACIRPFSGYGEDQDLTYPVPAIAQRAAKREEPFHVWGTGEQGRDFVYIDDCCDAFFVILDNVSDGSGINIGTGILHTFLEVAQIFAELEDERSTDTTGPYQPKVTPLVDKPMGVQSRYCDPTKVNSFGWTHKHSIRDGFRKVLQGAHERDDPK
jgi:nucleoside-diphosphate-sugar epimerase